MSDNDFSLTPADAIGHYQQAFELLMRAPVAICMLKLPDYVIELANPHMLELWDRDAGAIGKKITEVFTEVSEQGFSKMLEYVASTGKVFQQHERPVVIIRNGKRDQLYINMVLQPHYDEAGDMTGILAVANEVTAQVEARNKIAAAEETTRLAVDSAHLGSYELNLETNELAVTPRFVEIFGTGVAGDRNTFARTIHPDDRALRAKAHEVALETGNLEYEARIIWADKSQHWIKATGRVLYDVHRKPIRLLGIVQDITDEKEAAVILTEKIAARTLELEVANKLLAKSNAELEQFAYVTSHDLQEPLRKIQMYSSILLSKTAAGRDATEQAQKISDSAKRMTSLITDLLNYSRLSQQEPFFAGVDLNSIFKNVLSDFELMIEQKQAIITSDVLPFVPGISAQMNQLFYNLIGNSLKFARTGTVPQIRITCKKPASAEISAFPQLRSDIPYVQIDFTDNGIGFEQQYADRIFIVFQRLNNAQEYSGHGIGLAICGKIVSNHNGVIYAKSSPGEGATFCVILPMEQNAAALWQI
jgi:PAS domain S-box-containing protein